MAEPGVWSVVAHNTATQSQNKIHDDAVAKQYGFRGGLVPGVDDYAYLTHVPAELWGVDWLEHGTLSARFHKPVYEGDRIEVRPGPVVAGEGGDTIALELVDPEGTVCATGTAGMPNASSTVAVADAEPLAPLPDPPPAASPESLAVGTQFDLPTRPVEADSQARYRADVRDDLALYGAEGVAHPGWLLRLANRILAGNVALGPWIHVSSDVAHHGLARDGAQIGARSTISAEWEHKGHRFVTLDVHLVSVDGSTESVVASIAHTAIYQPRT
jgi:acyl dehydratase